MAWRPIYIGELELPNHAHLSEDDSCVFYGEYTARQGHAHSETNQLIYNVKKKPDRRGRAEWRYKIQAIDTIARIFSRSIKPESLNTAILVPMPPSKIEGDPLYDDRMYEILSKMGQGLDIRKLIKITENIQPSHSSDHRPTPDDLYNLMELDQSKINPTADKIFIFDDVLTTGAHFVAAKRHLVEAFPNASVTGFFVARRVPEAIDWDFDDLTL